MSADGEIAALREHLAREPADADSHRRLAELLWSQKRAVEAVPHFEAVVAARPGRPKLLRKLALMRAAAGQPAAALETWRQVVELDAADPEARRELARALQSQGQLDEALSHLEALVRAFPDEVETRKQIALVLHGLGREEAAVEHLRAASGAAPGQAAMIPLGSQSMLYEQDGVIKKGGYSAFRGEHTNFSPTDRSFKRPQALQQYFLKGLMPAEPLLDENSPIVAFGSCFADHISSYLDKLGYHVASRRQSASYLWTMGDGVVNTYAIRQQFEWAWEGRQPQVPLWAGYEAEDLGYKEDARLATRDMFDTADMFIITLGLSEVWYDEPTGEVFWQAVPAKHYDASRHKFRVASFAENLANLQAIHACIRRHRPGAAVVFTLSPIPLGATFRPLACTVADSASKAILRAALDEFFRSAPADDAGLFYFPSYEIAQRAFDHPWEPDRRHVQPEVLDLNMAVFERYFCKTGLTDEDLDHRLRAGRRKVARRWWAGPGGEMVGKED